MQLKKSFLPRKTKTPTVKKEQKTIVKGNPSLSKPRSKINLNGIGLKLNLAFILSLVMFGIVLSSIITPFITKTMKDSIQEQSLSVANTQMITLQNYINTSVEEIMIMSDILRNKQSSEISDGFSKMRGSNTKFLDIYHIGTDGNEVMRKGFSTVLRDRSNDEAYKESMKSTHYISPLHINQDGKGQPFTFEVAAPVTDLLNQPIGVIGTYIDTYTIWKETRGQTSSHSQKMYLVSKDGHVIAADDQEWLRSFKNNDGIYSTLEGHNGVQNLVNTVENEVISETELVQNVGTFTNDQGKEQVTAYIYNPKLEIAIFVETPAEVAFKPIDSMQRIIFLIILLSVLGISIFSFIFSQRIVSPLKKLISVTNAVAHGDLTKRSSIKRKDEIGTLANSFDEMINNLQNIVKNTQEASQQTFKTSYDLQVSAKEAAATSEQITAAIDEVARGAEQQASISQETDEKINQFMEVASHLEAQSSDVVQTAKQTQNSIFSNQKILEKLIAGVHSLAEKTTDSSNEVNKLENQTRQIRKIIERSNEIASQTNLLALNASIEAARAGEHGKGFAVVADEVRKLAVESNKATVEIENIIKLILESIQVVSKKMVESIDQAKEESSSAELAKDALTEIVHSMDKVLLSVDTMDRLLNEQKEYIITIQDHSKEGLSYAVQASSSTQEVAASTIQATGNMNGVITNVETLFAMAEQLNESVKRFKVADEKQEDEK